MVESATKVVLDLLARVGHDGAVLTEEAKSLSNLVCSIIGLTRHGAEYVGDAQAEVEQRLLRSQLISAEEVDCERREVSGERTRW